MSYLQKVVQQRGGAIRFIRAVEGDAMCWFYLRLNPDKLGEYEQKLKTGDMNVSDYGQILESDWGRYPPDDVVSFMREEYGFDTPAESD